MNWPNFDHVYIKCYQVTLGIIPQSQSTPSLSFMELDADVEGGEPL